MEKNISIPPSLLWELSESSFMDRWSDWFEDPRDKSRYELIEIIEQKTGGRYSGRGRPYSFTLTDDQLQVLREGIDYIECDMFMPNLKKAKTLFLRNIDTTLKGLKTTSERQTSHHTDVRAEAERVVRVAVNEMARVALRKSSDLPLPKRWRPTVKVSWLKSRSTSWGGHSRQSDDYLYGGNGGISLYLPQYVPVSGTGETFAYSEYKHIANDPTIGNFKCTDWRLLIKALVAHEMSHVIQYYINKYGKRGRHAKIDYERSHGQGFQKIYALLRSTCVNPYYK